MNITRNISLALIIALGLGMSACSSSHGSSDSNNDPIANAGVDQHVKTGHEVELNGVLSSDADGNKLTYKWSVVGPNGQVTLTHENSVHPYFTPDVDGNYVCTLVVEDEDNGFDEDTVTVTSNPTGINSIPVADAGADQHHKVGTQVTLDGSKSSDADHEDLTYKWTLVEKPDTSRTSLSDSETATPTFTEDTEGTYKFKLVVNDGTVDSAADYVTVDTTYLDSNAKPVAILEGFQYADAGDMLDIDGSKSTDADGDTLTYKWSLESFGGEAILSNKTRAETTLAVKTAGVHVVELIVNDGKVDSDPSYMLVRDRVTFDVLRKLCYNYTTLPDGRLKDEIAQEIIFTDTSKITDMATLFLQFKDFNLDISGWQTKQVTNMMMMFASTTNVNPDISGWDTSNVTRMEQMFQYATKFNKPLTSFNTSNVTNMRNMFQGAKVFDQNLSHFKTGNVTDMTYMFEFAESFDQNISDWNVSNVTAHDGFDGNTSGSWTVDKKPTFQ